MNNICNKREIDKLIERLGNEDTTVWQPSRFELARIGKPAVNSLTFALLYDSNPTVRWRAAEILGDIQESEIVQPLITALADDNSTVQWCCIEALINLGVQARWELTKALRHESEDVRWGVSRALEGIESRTIIEEQERLQRILWDNDLIVEAVDEAWYWQLVEGNLAQMCVPVIALG